MQLGNYQSSQKSNNNQAFPITRISHRWLLHFPSFCFSQVYPFSSAGYKNEKKEEKRFPKLRELMKMFYNILFVLLQVYVLVASFVRISGNTWPCLVAISPIFLAFSPHFPAKLVLIFAAWCGTSSLLWGVVKFALRLNMSLLVWPPPFAQRLSMGFFFPTFLPFPPFSPFLFRQQQQQQQQCRRRLLVSGRASFSWPV